MKAQTVQEWFFYIIRCKDNSLYSGITTNLDERLKKHNDGTGAKYTAGRKPVTLAYCETRLDRSQALKREAQIKAWTKARKENLIERGHRERKMDGKIKGYIEKQKSPQKEICLRLREIILETFPGIKEEVKWGAIVFSGGKFYVGALKDHVNLGFSVGGMSKEELALFEGSGKTLRHIKIRMLKDIDYGRIKKLLKLARECEGNC